MAQMKFKMNSDRAWLDRRCEHDNGMVSAGHIARDLDAVNAAPSEPDALKMTAFSKLIELRRRSCGFTPEELAKKADVELAELVDIEQRGTTPEPRTIHRLADTLKLPLQGLMELSGLAEPRSQRIGESAVRFAARSESLAKLTTEQREALEEFVRQLDRE
jgi:transcriptional regulator with XRE-family HTH domain